MILEALKANATPFLIGCLCLTSYFFVILMSEVFLYYVTIIVCCKQFIDLRNV